MCNLEQFVSNLLADGKVTVQSGDGMAYGVEKGWLETQDVTEKLQVPDRKRAARIIHNFLRFQLKETDEVDGSPAYAMKDLFDCRVCAGHIIQVYVKGIMEAKTDEKGNLVFLPENPVTDEEEELIRNRIFHPGKRRIILSGQKTCLLEPEQISMTQLEMLRKENEVVIVDVRMGREFERKHIEGAVNLPLLEIMKNPYAVSEDVERTIICYCEEGIQAAAAARCFLEAGYTKALFCVYK